MQLNGQLYACLSIRVYRSMKIELTECSEVKLCQIVAP